MASLLSWLGKELNQAKNAVGGAVHGAENQVSNAVHQVPQAVQQINRNPVYQGITRGMTSVQNSPDNPAGMFLRGLAQSHDISQAVRNANVGFRNAGNDFVVKPFESGISQTAAQLGHPMSIPSVLGVGGVGKLPSFTQNVAQAHGAGGKAAAVVEDLGNAVSLLPGGYGVKKAGEKLALPAIEASANAAGDIGKALESKAPLLNQAGHVPLPDTPQWAKAVKNSAEGATPEISDAGMKVKSSGVSQLQAGKPVYLSDLVKHKELNKTADFLMNSKDPRALKVVAKDNIPKAFIDKPNGVIYMPSGYVKNLDSELGRKTLMEEVQHSIDFHARRVSGTTPATEQLNAAPQEFQDAVKQSSALKPRVDELNKLVTKGNMTAEEVAKHPDTIAYQKALDVQKALKGQLPSAEEAGAMYRNNPGERIGSAVGDRSGLTQQQLRDNPMGLPLVEQRGATPAFAMSEGGPGRRAPQTLNTERLNISDEAKGEVNALSAPEELSRLSNKDVEQLSRSAGIDTKTHSLDRQKQIIAEQLNLRKQVVSLTNAADEKLKQGDLSGRAELLRQIADMGRTSTEQGSSVARQLQARRILANEMDTPMQRVFKLLDNAGVNPDSYIEKAASVNFENAPEVVRFYRSLVPAKAGDWLDLVRYNSMLSSPLTQIVNIASTAGNIAMAPIEKTITGLLDAGRVAVKGGERKYATGEGAAFVSGAAKSLPQAVSDFRRTLNELELDTHANAGIDDGRLPIAVHGDNKAVDALTFPMRVLSAFDAANKALVRGGSKAALNLRESQGLKLPGHKDLIGSDEAAYRTFNRPLGDKSQGHLFRGIDEVTNLVMKARSSKNPVVKYPATFTLPFVRIGVNLLKTGTEYSPFGVSSIPGALNKTEQLSKAIMGTVTMGTAAGLLGQGRLTWAEPTSQKQKDEFRAAGMQPYSIKIGNNWVSFAKLPPILSFNLAFVAGLDDTMKNAKLNQSGTDNLLTAVAKYGNFLADQSYYKSLGDALSAIKGDKEKFAQLVGNYPQQVVPYRAFGGWLAAMTDDTQRKINTDAGFAEKQVQSLFMSIPGLRETVPARTDNAGDPIAAQHPVLNAFSPAKITTEDPTHAQNLAEMQQKSLDNANNKILKKQNADSGDSLGGTDSLGKSQTRVDEVKKNFAKGLSDQSQKVLTDYARLNEQGRKQFSNNPKNDYNLSLAKFENDKLKGNLTPEEEFTKQNALSKQKVTSDYSKETNQLYNMSKTALNAFLTQHPEKQSLVADVLRMDQQLADTHFISRPKFGGTVAFKPKGGGRKGGRKGTGSRGGKPKSIIASVSGINKLLNHQKAIKAPKVHVPKVAKAKVSKAPHLKMATIKKKPSLA